MASDTKGLFPTELRRSISQGVNLSSPQLTIVAGTGQNARTFYIHEAIASHHSEFFAAALKNGWKEAEERVVRFPEDTPEHFEVFARFAYSYKLYVYAESDKKGTNDDEWARLHKCWALGDKLGSITFKDAVADAICDKMAVAKRYCSSAHEVLYPVSTPKSPIRQLLVDVAVYWWSADNMKNKKQHETFNEFFKDVAVKLLEVSEKDRKADPPFLKPGCKYHEHAKGASACYLNQG